MAAGVGVLFCLLAFIGIIFVIVRALMFGDPTSGWPSLVCIILLCSGVQLFCTGIVGEYLAKTYLEVKHRPIYICGRDRRGIKNKRWTGRKRISLWWAKNFRPLVVALLVGCGVHYTIYANQLGTMDAVHIGALYIADSWPEHLYWGNRAGPLGTAPGGYAARRHQPACTFCIADAVPLRAGGCAADGFVRRAQPHGKISDSPYAGLCALCGGDRVFPLLQRVLCAVLPAGCAGGAVRCLRCTLCLAGGHGLYGVLRWVCTRPIWVRRQDCASCC